MSSMPATGVKPRGIVVAITGPDGSGKTTQSARVAERLQGRFRCRTLYLGSNQGGFVVRRSVGRLRTARRARRANDEGSAGGWLHVTASSLWRLSVAARRYQSVIAAKRLAAAGAIVICDRWPQNFRPGMMDGPSLPPPHKLRIARALSWLERVIYSRMARYRPALMIHLLCDYETSCLHKPGDLDEAKFHQRMALLEEMRGRDPSIIVVDGGHSADEVTTALLVNIRQAISDHGDCAADGRPAAPVPGNDLHLVEER